MCVFLNKMILCCWRECHARAFVQTISHSHKLGARASLGTKKVLIKIESSQILIGENRKSKIVNRFALAIEMEILF